MNGWAEDMAETVREFVSGEVTPLRQSLAQSEIKMATQLHLHRHAIDQEVQRLIEPIRTETAELRSSVVDLLGRVETELTEQKRAFAALHTRPSTTVEAEDDQAAALAEYIERELSHA